MTTARSRPCASPLPRISVPTARRRGRRFPWFGACMTTGCYDIRKAYVDVEMVVTNTVPVDAYRGAGRPEAAYVIERLMDKAAAGTRADAR